MSKSIVMDADSRNIGNESQYKGDIARHIGSHVFYRTQGL
jgi:hypothetical protein